MHVECICLLLKKLTQISHKAFAFGTISPFVVTANQKESGFRKDTSTKVKLFNHLYAEKGPENIINSNAIQPAIVKLGAQYANGNIVGSHARCIAFMERIKNCSPFYGLQVIEDYTVTKRVRFWPGSDSPSEGASTRPLNDHLGLFFSHSNRTIADGL